MKLAFYGLLAGALLAQTASFDVASIKPSNAPPGSSGIDSDKGFLRAYNVTLKHCISVAYALPEAQISGGPKWMDELRFDITAKTEHQPAGVSTVSMLQGLMADRFHLALHRQTETVSGYSLAIAKGGIKATLSDPEARSSTNSSRTRIDAKGCLMSRLAAKLAATLSMPVIDETQETRKFDFSLQWVPDEVTSKAAPGSDAANGPSIFTAVQEQLGLKLEARKVPVDFIVVDHLDPPSEN
jgi:uncharacterized protein (TIGR03435 family)